MREDRGPEGVRYLLAEYCQTIDDGHDEQWAGLFEDDASFLLDDLGELSGRESIRTFVTGALSSLAEYGIAGINHLTLNSTITVDGDTATVTSDFAVIAPINGGFATVLLGRYHDVLAHADRWRFRRRRISWFKGELPPAFAAALAPVFQRAPA